MLCLSVTEVANAGALDSVSTTARNRRIFAWHETGPDLRVLSRARRPDGREEFSASCDTHVGRRRPRIPFTPRNKPLNRAFPGRGGRSVMTAAGLVVTDLSHLDVGLDIRGDFRRPVRFAVSSKPSRPARRCDRVSTWLRWVGECGESCPLMSISPARGRTCGRFPPGGDGSPAARDAPGVWQVGCVVHGGLLRAGNGARQAVSC